MPSNDAPVLYYDGECGLCARSVQWCLKWDRRGELRFAPLQGSTYASLQALDKPNDVSSMVLSQGDELYTHSSAVLKMLSHMGGLWSFLGGLGRLIPRPLRDAAYRFVAMRRLKWFGPADYCNLPNPTQRLRFLD